MTRHTYTTMFTNYPENADTNTLCALHGHVAWERWRNQARPAQIPGLGLDEWAIHTYRGGRGSGKTRSAAEWLVAECLMYPGLRCGVLTPDWAHYVDVCVKGESGILAVIGREDIAVYEIGAHRIMFANGSTIQGYTSERPKKLRGPQFHRFWIDEPADLWNGLECFNNARGAVRLPGHGVARTFVTGTPRNVPILNELDRLTIDAPDRYPTSRGSMRENEDNLDPIMVAEMYARYPKGSTYYRQEIEGELILEAEGAIWKAEWITKNNEPITCNTIAVSVDPADSTDGDECGIIVGGVYGQNQRVRVLGDHTLNASMLDWVQALPGIATAYGASTIVLESNFAGATMKTLINEMSVGSNLIIRWVPAKGDKATRARPVAALYEAGLIEHAPGLDRLEAEMLLWEPAKMKKSPNRVDALVHLCNHLRSGGQGSSLSPSQLLRGRR